MFKSFGVLVLTGLNYLALYLVGIILETHLRTNLDIYDFNTNLNVIHKYLLKSC
jgi:hypothetical protein